MMRVTFHFRSFNPPVHEADPEERSVVLYIDPAEFQIMRTVARDVRRETFQFMGKEVWVEQADVSFEEGRWQEVEWSGSTPVTSRWPAAKAVGVVNMVVYS